MRSEQSGYDAANIIEKIFGAQIKTSPGDMSSLETLGSASRAAFWEHRV